MYPAVGFDVILKFLCVVWRSRSGHLPCLSLQALVISLYQRPSNSSPPVILKCLHCLNCLHCYPPELRYTASVVTALLWRCGPFHNKGLALSSGLVD